MSCLGQLDDYFIAIKDYLFLYLNLSSSLGIDSCRNAQASQHRKDQREVVKFLDKLAKEKSKYCLEEEEYFAEYAPGDGITTVSFCDLTSSGNEISSDDTMLKDVAEDDEPGDFPIGKQQEGSDDCKENESLEATATATSEEEIIGR